MIYAYPQEVHDFVKEMTKKLRDDDLAEETNKRFGTQFTKNSMKAFRGNHRYFNGKKQWTSEEYWKYQKRYPKGMYEFIRDNSWGVSSLEMANMVNERFGTKFTQSGMKQFRQRHGIKSGVTGWYQKGHAPGTKGKKQEDYIKDPEAMARARATRFEKGHRPKNELPVGTVVVAQDGYKLIKVDMDAKYIWDRWKFLHRLTWELNNGPVPEGMCVTFKDGDRGNCDINNLILMTKGENATMTGLKRRCNNPDITESYLYLTRLENEIKRKRK